MEQLLLLALEDDGLNLNVVRHLVEDLRAPLEMNNNDRVRRARNEGYLLHVVPRYSDALFKEHFRMSRHSFEVLTNLIAPHMGQRGYFPLRLEEKLMFTVWMLAKRESFLSAGDRFGLAKSCAHKVMKEVVTAIIALLPQMIQWPAEDQRQLISTIFQEQSRGFPGVVGAIDGCHIPIKQPVNNAIDFYNRKSFHSVILMAVCDHNGKFTYIDVGFPGRMHDARVFRNGQLYRQLNGNAGFLPQHQHIIGDCAFPLMNSVMTPFRDDGHLTPRLLRYNTALSSIRSTIERAFAFLKNRFRRLKYLDVSDIELGNNMIAAACVLHNFITMQGGNEMEEDAMNDLQPEELPAAEEEVLRHHREAVEKRSSIVDLLL